MSKYPNKIPFDFEKLKAGYQAVTRDDELVVEWHLFEKVRGNNKIVIILESGKIIWVQKNDGKFNLYEGQEYEYDLFLLSKKTTLWAYASGRGDDTMHVSFAFPSKEALRDAFGLAPDAQLISFEVEV